ncbi:DNA cytosine methyltransferase [Bacillus paralicheniformis]|uniref:DNA cytosine methyltransferase n=1 Tax=Bacillus paralicheniformis TaxID=1648923 RepID=UPI000F6CAC15|nr:DNA cytosine methyltransferase [Bacillus paralicheniformis]MBG9882817.1 DNA methyltransferase [Bacillus paralicheniformis]MCY7461945.1 DNA cytosine methyltransferase [Bacillus paralicheniformis]MDE1394028.1 DNA cytosine methyltransferase [Bacillus paralicheniformis]MEC1934964.1 DNA cytosine methyltransferase [Bacillus paralicheniformis]MEC2097277.1 DNA cytosine methyltransferase [Bacillus paralicheniformis]
MKQLSLFREIIVDNFAGGGGASTGIELATGLSVDIAINHDPAAIAMHQVNHPDTEHYCESVWEVDPREVAKGRPIGLAWFSPDCKHFSKAKGGKPVEKSIRGLAWVAVRWAATVSPRVIILENVEEFQTWGPLTKDGRPDPDKKGYTFRSFVRALNKHGYKVEWRELKACDYGAPTIRKRLFLIARRDGRPIIWPEPTHGDPKSTAVKSGKLRPWRTASEIMDWSLETPSIFDRKKPLSENTLRRIARGIQRFVIESKKPFVVEDRGNSLIQMGYGDPEGRRVLDLKKPLGTITAGGNKIAIATSHLIKLRGTCKDGQPVTNPMPTITAGGLHVGEVRAFLTKYYGSDIGQSLDNPLHTVTTKDRFGLVTIKGENYQIADIGMRMLQPHELFAAQGFPSDYVIDRDINEVKYSKAKQVERCGNAVPPPFAEHLVRANLPELCVNDDMTKFTRLKAN